MSWQRATVLEKPRRKMLTFDRSHLVPRDPLCGIVLAGGEGKRLRPFVHLLRKDLLPKQYVNFIGSRSMLEHTLNRAERLIPSERLFTVINEAHLSLPEVQRQIWKRPAQTMVVQPENRETGPGLLLPLIHLTKHYPNPVVAILPSDHFVLEEDKLMRQVHLAHQYVKNNPSRLVLLGIEPDRDDPEYGYILPEKNFKGAAGPVPIARFIEKPDPGKARDLILNGALWNTMMMVCRAETLLRLVSEIEPNLYSRFQQIYEAVGTAVEKNVIREIYQQLAPVNFSKGLLEPYVQTYPSSVLALRVRDVLWSDWGTESRVMEVLRRTGHIARLNGLAVHQPLTNEIGPAQLAADPQMPRAKQISARSKQRMMRLATRPLS
jgi:mannose-1-phosphate guanylyltransferase